MERRSVSSRFTADGNKLVGYAAVWNSPARIFEKGKLFTEVVRAGAFRTAIESGGDVIATFNHNPSALLGRVSSRTLTLAEDEHGLRFAVELPDTATGNEVRTLCQRGDLKGCSFAFSIRQGGEKWDGDTRELTDLFLHELGPVTQPAYPDTSLAVRCVDYERINRLLRSILNSRR